MAVILAPSPRDAARADNRPIVGTANPLAWHPCPYDPDKLNVVRCGHMFVDGPAPATLPVALIQADPTRLSDTALLYLQGGPGGGSWLAPEQFNWPLWLRGAGLAQDLVVFDQRGTGIGDPSLSCTEYDDLIRPWLASGWFSDRSVALYAEATAACHRRLTAEGQDLEQFTNLRNAEDVLALMDALPYSDWTLIGASYGSRLALEVMRSQPAGLRSVVLDGVLPPDVEMLLEGPAHMDRAIGQIGDACSVTIMGEPLCLGSPEKFERRLNQVFARLSDDPRWIGVVDWASEETYKIRVDPAVLLDALHSAMTYPDGAEMAHTAVMDAALGKHDLLDWLLESWAHEQIGYDIHDPVFLSVLCDMDSRSTREDLNRQFSDSRYYHYFPGPGVELDICAYWTASRAPDAHSQPVMSAIPTLLFSGEYDPLTPVAWGERAAASLENGHHFIVPRGGHVSLFTNTCAIGMINAFLADPDTEPNSECLGGVMPGIKPLQ